MKTKKGKDVPKPENHDFPDPDANEEEMYWGRDAATCLHKAAEYEKWAERARSCGRNDLATLYEIKAEELFFASLFGRKLQNVFGENCISILAKVAAASPEPS